MSVSLFRVAANKKAPVPARHKRVPLERGLNVMLLQVLPDDPRDDAHGHATLHIQAGDGRCHG